MTLPLISFWVITGILPLLWLARLPPWWLALLFSVLAVIFWRGRWRRLRYVSVSLFSFAFSLLYAQQVIWPLTHITSTQQQAELRITQTDGATHHQGKITRLNGQPMFPAIAITLISRRLPVAVCAGQHWQMSLKLRPEHASLNEGGFDAQRYALAQHRVLHGRVLDAQPLETNCSVRADYLHRVQQALVGYRWADVVLALGFGERTQLSQSTKRLLRNTATAHLMAISGLHIGFAALLGSWLTRLLQGLLPGRYIGHRLPVVIGLCIALLYTWLSGASPSAQRSLIAVLCWSLLRLSGRQWYPWSVWLCCLAGVLLADPLSVLSDSFWLSAFAVAALIFWYQWIPLPGFRIAAYWRYPLGLLHLQTGIMLLLLPVQLLLFHGISLSAIPANLLAVPMVALIGLPLIFTAMLATLLPWPAIAQPFWWLADQCLDVVFRLLESLPAVWLVLDQRLIWLSVLPWLAIILWRSRCYLFPPASITVLLVLLSWPLWRSTPPDVWAMHMLDVGQAQAVVIERQGKALLYDAGTSWPGGDQAQQTLIPWLQWHHLEPQVVVLSRISFDSRSNLHTLLQMWPNLQVIRPPGDDGGDCARDRRWFWQGLQLQAHWPISGQTSASETAVCVISVTDGIHRLLLTGHLNTNSEQDILRNHWDTLQSEVLLVPGLGSNRASSDLLLSRVNGRLALASLARYGNRKTSLDKVKQRYAAHHYAWYDTAHSGQITLRFTKQSMQLQTFRQHIQPRWYHQWFQLADDT